MATKKLLHTDMSAEAKTTRKANAKQAYPIYAFASGMVLSSLLYSFALGPWWFFLPSVGVLAFTGFMTYLCHKFSEGEWE